MKKTFFALIIIILLSSCSSNIDYLENMHANSYAPQTETVNLPDGINPSDYDSIERVGPVFILSRTEGTRISEVWGNNGLRSLEEVPNTQFWLLSKNGEFLNNESFQKYGIYEGNPGEWWVYGIRNGILYPYYIDENTGKFSEDNIWGPEPKNIFGYTIYKYYWHNHTPSYGVISPNGNTFLEPIYHNVQVPFRDRIIFCDGNDQIFGLSVCYIMNAEKEILSSCFNRIWYSVFDNGSYIGIAMCGGNETDGKMQLYDSEGNPMPEGYWFVDKNGKIISERYDSIYINEEWNFISESEEDTVFAITDSGDKIEFRINDVLISS